MRAVVLAMVLVPALVAGAGAQALPFAAGERLTYGARVGSVGRGTAVMWIEGPIALRGRPVLHLRFDVHAKVGFINVVNASESWLDPVHMASLRFHKRERHPLSKREQRADVYPEEQRWAASDGESGRTMSEQPLDELSFIYFLRTTPLQAGGVLRYDRHFEMDRNPTMVKVLGHETLETRAGVFETIVVEMHVRDGRYGGGGTIRLNLSNDAQRLPVRIESSVPVVGKVVLTLETYTPGSAGGAALD